MQERTLCFLCHGNPRPEVLLGLKKVGFGVGKYAGFGGGIEPGESITQAAVREVYEEAGLRVAEADLQKVAVLTFRFPAKPAWSQVVHVFLATMWVGSPTESVEMRPVWYPIAELPLAAMWQDARHWLPRILAGERGEATFTFAEDNETIAAVTGHNIV